MSRAAAVPGTSVRIARNRSVAWRAPDRRPASAQGHPSGRGRRLSRGIRAGRCRPVASRASLLENVDRTKGRLSHRPPPRRQPLAGTRGSAPSEAVCSRVRLSAYSRRRAHRVGLAPFFGRNSYPAGSRLTEDGHRRAWNSKFERFRRPNWLGCRACPRRILSGFDQRFPSLRSQAVPRGGLSQPAAGSDAALSVYAP